MTQQPVAVLHETDIERARANLAHLKVQTTGGKFGGSTSYFSPLDVASVLMDLCLDAGIRKDQLPDPLQELMVKARTHSALDLEVTNNLFTQAKKSVREQRKS